MRYIFLVGLVISIFFSKAVAQNRSKLNNVGLTELEDSIADISTQLTTDTLFYLNNERNSRLEVFLEKFFKQSGSFGYPLQKVNAISILSPEDKTFRIFTWSYLTDSIHVMHKGYVLLNTPKPLFKKLSPTVDISPEAERQVLTPDTWIGALYYNLKTFEVNGEPRYLLFGVNYGNAFEKSKICEVLRIKNKTITFGAPVFVKNRDETKVKSNRLVLTYSNDAEVHLNYDTELNLIVFDHLTDGTNSANQNVLVPDGTYEAYKFEKNEWRYIEQLPTTKMTEAPRPKPLENKSKQIYSSPTKFKN